MHPKNLRAYLDSAAGIAALLPQAERLLELRRIYDEIVPHQLSRSSSIVNYKRGNVVIFAESSAIAAKLKLLSPGLINDFSKRGAQVTGIRVEVQPRREAPGVPQAKQARLSKAGAAALAALSRRLPESRLQRAVANFARQDAEDAVAKNSTGDAPDRS